VSEPIAIIRPGSPVRLKLPGDKAPIPARIAQVAIQPDAISYQVEWWDGRVRYIEWFDPDQLDADHAPRIPLGFLRP
jgi:hypothetical protein